MGQPSDEGGATLEQIKQQHVKNRLEDNQCSSAKEYIRKVLYKVPLDKLYKVLFSCLYEENAEFCPVIVKIIDDYILQ